jgi:hypothetical protein
MAQEHNEKVFNVHVSSTLYSVLVGCWFTLTL